MTMKTDTTPSIPPYYKILLVEDDMRLSSLVVEYLQKNDLEVETDYRGDTAVQHILDYQPDLVVLDLMLPGLDGFEVCKQVRSFYQKPILMMTAKNEDIDQIVGLEIGADDYIIKPVQPRLLLARIHALLRRSQPQATENHVNTEGELIFSSLRISQQSRSVYLHQEPIDFTTTEFELLWLLASNAGKILDRDFISKTLYGFEYDGLDRSIDIRISRLRKLLKDNPQQPQGIKTIRGKGYLFVANGWKRSNV